MDADLGMADLPERRGPDLHDVLAGRAAAVEAVDESGPVDLLPCGRTLAGARASDPRALRAALSAVEAEYGRVVVDCPAGLGRDSGAALAAADACLLVTTAERAAVADALRTRELARALDAGLVGVVVDFAEETGPLRGRFGAPATALPESEAVRRATRHGLPVGEVAPESVVAERLEEVAALVQRSTRSV
ncbi:chromosome partitioning protein ParA [Halosegnis marinus]|uniref:chromosome partitioning protein ParA n=1 Tax=Halosegnis marinus TaxID=3034023 RepID=UPI0036136ADD